MNIQQEVARSFGTVVQMLRDRGVDAPVFSGMSSDDIIAYAGGKPVFFLDDEACGHRLIYELSPKFKLSNIRKLLDPKPEHVSVFIVVVRDTRNAAAVKSIDELGLDVQFFDVRELLYNVSRHELVPKHEPIRDEAQIDEIVKTYALKTRLQLPIIYSADPMARYLGLKHGQLVRIVRPSPSAGTYELYRCCLRAR